MCGCVYKRKELILTDIGQCQVDASLLSKHQGLTMYLQKKREIGEDILQQKDKVDDHYDTAEFKLIKQVPYTLKFPTLPNDDSISNKSNLCFPTQERLLYLLM